MYTTNEIRTWLDKAKWSGARTTGAVRQREMMGYLSELVDHLLMDRRDTYDSEAPGFESPLYAFEKQENKKD